MIDDLLQGADVKDGPRVPNGKRPDFGGDLAAQKAGLEGWQWFKWEAVGRTDRTGAGGDSLYTGAVPIGHYTRGPRKGRPKWDLKNAMRVVVLATEIDAAMRAYEASTGNCHNCGGGGQQWASWSIAEGTKYRTCTRCKGTGCAPARRPIAEEA